MLFLPNPFPYAWQAHNVSTQTHTHTHSCSMKQTRCIRASNANVKFKELTRAYCKHNKNHNNDNELLPKTIHSLTRTHTHWRRAHITLYAVFLSTIFQCRYVLNHFIRGHYLIECSPTWSPKMASLYMYNIVKSTAYIVASIYSVRCNCQMNSSDKYWYRRLKAVTATTQKTTTMVPYLLYRFWHADNDNLVHTCLR